MLKQQCSLVKGVHWILRHLESGRSICVSTGHRLLARFWHPTTHMAAKAKHQGEARAAFSWPPLSAGRLVYGHRSPLFICPNTVHRGEVQ